MDDIHTLKTCSFCNLFSAIKCMMQELNEDHVRKEHTQEKTHNDCTESASEKVFKDEYANNEVLPKSETTKKSSGGSFFSDSTGNPINHSNDDSKDNIDKGTFNFDVEGSMEIVFESDDNFDNESGNAKFAEDTSNNDKYKLDDVRYNDETTINHDDTNGSTEILSEEFIDHRDDLKESYIDDETVFDKIIDNSFKNDVQGKEKIQNKQNKQKRKAWDHFKPVPNIDRKAACNHCGKCVSKTSYGMLKHLNTEHQLEFRTKSIAWDHFKPVPNMGTKAECNYCGKWVSKSSGTTSNMLKHLNREHQMEFQSFKKVKQAQINSNRSIQKNISMNEASSITVRADVKDIVLIDGHNTFNGNEINDNHVLTNAYIKSTEGEIINEVNNLNNKFLEVLPKSEIVDNNETTMSYTEDTYINEDANYVNDNGHTESKYKYNALNGKKIYRRVKKSQIWYHCKLMPNSEDTIACNYCDVLFYNQYGSTTNIARHLKKHHPGKVQSNLQKSGRKLTKRSIIWEHCKLQPNTENIECMYCNKSFSRGNTSNMHIHLRKKHPEKLRTNSDDPNIRTKHPNEMEVYTAQEMNQIQDSCRSEMADKTIGRGKIIPSKSVWEHFIFQPNTQNKVKCKYCDNCGKPSTMILHLRKNHPAVMETFIGGSKEDKTENSPERALNE